MTDSMFADEIYMQFFEQKILIFDARNITIVTFHNTLAQKFYNKNHVLKKNPILILFGTMICSTAYVNWHE